MGVKGEGSLKKILKFCNDGICNNANSLPCPKTSVYSDFNRKACRRTPVSLRLWSKTFPYILSVVNFGKRSDVSAYPNFRNTVNRVSLTPTLSKYRRAFFCLKIFETSRSEPRPILDVSQAPLLRMRRHFFIISLRFFNVLCCRI